MTRTFLSYSCGLALLLSATAQADIEIRFSEGAPKDRFIITNQGECKISNLTLDLDLSKSQGKLIFDITAAGSGVDVFQPFEITEGKMKLASGATVKDGDSSLSLQIESINPGERVSFTIDVDDTLPVSSLGMIRVAGSEIQGGEVTIQSVEIPKTSAVFGNNSRAMVVMPKCA